MIFLVKVVLYVFQETFPLRDRKLSQVCGKSVKSQDDEEDYGCFLNLCFFNASPSAPGWFLYPPGKSAKTGLENPPTTGRIETLVWNSL